MAQNNAASLPLDADSIGRLRDAIMAGLPNGKRVLTFRRIEAAIDTIIGSAQAALHADTPAVLDELLNLVLIAQRKQLNIPDGEGGPARLQELAVAWQANSLPDEQRRLFERNAIAGNVRFNLRVLHPELSVPHPPPDPVEAGLIEAMDKLAGPFQEAKQHTVPGMITPEWLDRLVAELASHRVLLDGVAPGNKFRPYLCYAMASGAYALGRGRDQLSQTAEAQDSYAQAAQLYTEAGEPEDAAAAAEQASWLGFSLRADIDGGSFDDLQRLASGIADPLVRAGTLNRLARRATQANDQTGAFRYANAAAGALADAGYPDCESGPMAAVVAAWIATAAGGRTGNAAARLLQRVGDMALGVLSIRHTHWIGTDPLRANGVMDTIALLSAALLQIVAQPDAVAAEIRQELHAYMPDLHQDDDPAPATGYEQALALWPRIGAITDAVNAEAVPPDGAAVEAAAIVAEADALGQPGLIAGACLAQAQLLERLGDLPGSAGAAEAGEAALLSGHTGPEALTNPNEFGAFLTLRQHRVGLAAGAKDTVGLLDLAEGAIRAIEAVRYRISDPYQQASYLTERTRFYEMAAFAAFKLERWDNLIAVMDLFRSRSALRNRLAPPPDDSVADLADKVAEVTRLIEAAPPGEKPALRDHRRILWSMLSIARMRGAAGQVLPELTVASVQEALAPDEAVVSWLWVGSGILIVLALDKTQLHAERVILTDDQRMLLGRHVTQARSGRMAVNLLGQIVDQLADAVFPLATRAFVAQASRLILSPHRTLHLLPFHAARFDGQFLIERAAVRYVPNLGSLVMPWHGTREGNVVAIGINAFGRDGIRPLKTPEAEAEAVARAWGAQGVPAQALIGDAATRDAFTALPLDQCRCLHLATHGSSVFADETGGDPFASRLCFWDGDIEALGLAELPLRAELVVMSACYSGQRALGLPGLSELPGDDLFGLQAALFQAGVRGVIGALWPLNDDSALSLLPELHRRLALGAAPEEALRGAVCAYLQLPGSQREIYYWAPLFLSSIGRLPE